MLSVKSSIVKKTSKIFSPILLKMADADIDLYADVEGDFAGEDFGGNDGHDLYDDVLSHPKDEKPGVIKNEALSPPAGTTAPSMSHSSMPQGKKYQIYVGNLTWWTTDNDIQEAIASCGASDFLEVKFNENRINGQSKGFCCVSLGSETSMRLVMEKLVKQEIHGQAPVVTYATKTALIQFEAQSKTRAPQPPPQQQQQQQLLPPMPPRVSAPPPAPIRGYAPRPPYSIRGPPPMISAPPPMIHHVPPPMTAGIPPPTLISHVVPPPMMTAMPPRGPPPAVIHPGGPAPHVNPAFFAQGPPGYPPPMHHGLGEAEFEEIMSRNRTVSSSAIARAVQDAANNEFSSAIETLVTAISLIKQSKVANDDRCKILVASLQDTLTGIENKNYSSRRERSRSRERAYRSSHRSYSRERDYRPREYRERSRERDRDYYRDREREYYEERQRYKERERMDRERERESGRVRGGDGDMERERVDMRGSEREKERERPRH